MNSICERASSCGLTSGRSATSPFLCSNRLVLQVERLKIQRRPLRSVGMREIRAILREDHGIARVIELNRPDRRNALSAQLLSELNEALEEADKDDSVRAVVIRGSEVVFSAGADLREALEATTVRATLRFLAALRRVNTTIGLPSKPVIALIRGYCLTGGLELAMACDVRVAEIGSQFGITSSRIGSIAGAGGTQRLARLVGTSVAKELLFSARMFDAE